MKSEQKRFLTAVREAIKANPFDAGRTEIDRTATGLGKEAANSEILATMIGRTREVLDEVTASSTVDSGEQELIRYGQLFYTFHLFCDAYDRHITEQIAAGDTCIPFAFGREVLTMLHEQGFSDKTACLMTAFFFQMRRAYFFINRIAGSSNCMAELRKSLWNNIFTADIALYERHLWQRMEDFSTILLGPTGTGKGIAAAAIGRSGFIPYSDKTDTFAESFARAFISINLSQYPEQLIESELFGHRKGAFTGAVDNHQGIFSRCSPCGAIFLDEVGDVAEPVQIKLLQVLQERLFTPVGSHKAERFQGRVIAATNRDIEELKKQGIFREDFFYRISSDLIHLPPLATRLRENPEELGELVQVVIARILEEPNDELAARLTQKIEQQQPQGYSWPGNIRELEQCVRRLLLGNSYSWKQQAAPGTLLPALLQSGLTAQQLLETYCRALYAQFGTYEEVAKRVGLDRRTVKKYI